MARLILPKHGVLPENTGELRVIKFLLDNLPPKGQSYKGWENFQSFNNEYIIIPNVEIPDTASRFLEIDAIIVAPHAIYVVETKDWGTKIKGDDTTWYLSGNNERKNPHRTLNYKCRVLKSILERSAPDLRHVWLQGIVVIAQPQVELLLNGSCKKLTFAMNNSLYEYLRDYNRLQTPKKIKSNELLYRQQEICEIISGKSRPRSNIPLVIQGYEIKEKLYTEENLVEYLAKPERSQGTPILKRLRVFTLPAIVNKKDKEVYERRILRDYEVLEAVGTHPNIVSSKGVFNYESNQLVEILDWAEEGTLKTVLSKESLDFNRIKEIIKGIASGLKAAHKKSIIHRDLKPENILITAYGPQIMNFDLAYVPQSGTETVWKTVTESDDKRYLPPELSLSKDNYNVYESSDLYSLGVMFYEMLTRNVPFSGPEQLQSVGGKLPEDLLPSKKLNDLPVGIDNLIQKLYTSDIENRYSSVDEFINDFELALNPPVINDDSDEDFDSPNRILQKDEKVGDFRIVKYLGGGGFAQVYLAKHMLQGKDYALKVNNQSVPLSHLIDEFTMLDQLRHPNIVKVFWSGQVPGGRYYIAMEYLKGEALSTYAWGKKKLTCKEVLDVAEDMLSALRYMHEGDQKKEELTGKVLYHRDIKPSNIIKEPDRGYVLIDFNIAKESSNTETYVGTGPYIAPDLVNGNNINWDSSGDTFALGVTLYELLCKKHPYTNNEPKVGAKPLDASETEAGKDIPDPVKKFIMKAIQTKSSERFATSKEMEEALFEVVESLDKKEKPNANVDLETNVSLSQSQPKLDQIKISEAKVNMIIKGPMFSEPIKILQMNNLGNTIQIIGQGINTNTVHMPFIDINEVVSFDSSPEQANYEGKSKEFKLGIEAMRLGLAYEYDPFFSLSIARIDPLPHQLEAVYDYFMKLPRIRFLLADDPGAGKTIMAGLLIKELKIRGLIERILIVTPANLSFQWQRELKDKFREDFEVVRGEVLRSTYGNNPWKEKKQVVTSISWISRIEDAKNSLLSSEWDLVIVDEAHKMSAYSSDRTTMAYDIGKELSKRTDHLLLMTATPHKGDPENFRLFLELLDSDVYADISSLEQAMNDQKAPFYLRRVKEALVTFPDPNTGKVQSLFTKREVSTTEFNLNSEEGELYDLLTEYVEEQSVRASQDNSARGRALGFTMAMLQRRFASSIYALRCSLVRMKEKREKILADPEAYKRSQLMKKLPDDFDELTDTEQQDILNQLENIVASFNPEDLRKEINNLKNLITHAELLEEQEIESKLSELKKMLTKLGIFSDTKMKLLIFTEHKDTLDYIVSKLESWKLTVTQIHGGMKVGDRDTPNTRIYAEREFRESCQVLVATEAAGEGINLQFCWLMINYDIPWNPIRLEQRMGRIHRYGQEKDCLIFNFVSVNTREGRVFAKLFERIRRIEEDLDPERTGKIFNVLGDVFPSNELERLLRQMYSRNLNEDNIKDRIVENIGKERFEKITHSTLEGLAKRELNLSAIFERSSEAKERRLVPEVIENFFIEAAPLIGVFPNQIRTLRNIYKVGRIPRTLRPIGDKLEQKFGKLGREYNKIVFDKNLLKSDPLLEWVTPGHPLFECVRTATLEYVQPHLEKGTVFYDINIAKPIRLTVFVASIIDGRGNTLHKCLYVIQTSLDGKMELKQPTIFLDLISATDNHKLPDENILSNLQKQQEFLIENALNESLRSSRFEREKEVNIVLEHLQLSLNQLIHKQSMRMADLYEQSELINVEQQIKNVEEKIDDLNFRLENRERELYQEKNCTIADIKPIGKAWVIPHPQRISNPQVAMMVKDEVIEKKAIDAVIAYEKSRGYEVISVESENKGFDLVSRKRPEGAEGYTEMKYIEVKGRSFVGEVGLTSNEYHTAVRLKQDYWLYVVFNCATEPEIQIIQDPAKLGWQPVRIIEHYHLKAEQIIEAARETMR